MEKWIADRPDHPGEAAKQWLKDLYQDNKLVRNELELAGAGSTSADHHAGAQRLRQGRPHHPARDLARAGGKSAPCDYTELALPGGHVGVFVGGKSQRLLGPGIAEWLAQHDDRRAGA